MADDIFCNNKKGKKFLFFASLASARFASFNLDLKSPLFIMFFEQYTSIFHIGLIQKKIEIISWKI